MRWFKIKTAQPKNEQRLPEGMQQANTTMVDGKECFLPSGFGSYVPNPWVNLPISEYTGQTYDPRWAVPLRQSNGALIEIIKTIEWEIKGRRQQ